MASRGHFARGLDGNGWRKDDDKDRHMPVHNGGGDTLRRIRDHGDWPSSAVGRGDQGPPRGECFEPGCSVSESPRTWSLTTMASSAPPMSRPTPPRPIAKRSSANSSRSRQSVGADRIVSARKPGLRGTGERSGLARQCLTFGARHRSVRPLSDGRTVGGIPFTRGPVAYLLRNRLYIGEVVFKGARGSIRRSSIVTCSRPIS
jgi:hypothetical protein